MRIAICKRLWVVAIPIALGGWFSDQQRQFDECRAASPTDEAIQRCMVDHGYRRDFDGGQCKERVAPSRTAYCYEPRNSVSSILFKAQMLIGVGDTNPKQR
jgi:hypothetical protein